MRRKKYGGGSAGAEVRAKMYNDRVDYGYELEPVQESIFCIEEELRMTGDGTTPPRTMMKDVRTDGTHLCESNSTNDGTPVK